MAARRKKQAAEPENETEVSLAFSDDTKFFKELRPAAKVVIDGPNVSLARRKNGKKYFSVRQLLLVFRFFKYHGNPDVLAIFPVTSITTEAEDEQFQRKKGGKKADEPEILKKLHNKAPGFVFFTPEKWYDDLVVIQYAMKNDADIITNDQHRDVLQDYSKKSAKRLQAYFAERKIGITWRAKNFLIRGSRYLNPSHAPDCGCRVLSAENLGSKEGEKTERR